MRPAPDERQDRPKARGRGETVEELVLWAEDKAGSQDHRVWKLVEHRLLAFRLGARICTRCWMLYRDGGDVYQPGAGLACGFGHRPCAYHMDACESLPLRTHTNASQIHDDVCALNRSSDGIVITYVGLHGMNLADIAHRLQMPCEVRSPVGAENAPSVSRQGANRIAAKKP